MAAMSNSRPANSRLTSRTLHYHHGQFTPGPKDPAYICRAGPVDPPGVVGRVLSTRQGAEMATFARHADVEWTGGLMDGKGEARAGTGAFALPVTFPSRVGEPDGKTTP